MSLGSGGGFCCKTDEGGGPGRLGLVVMPGREVAGGGGGRNAGGTCGCCCCCCCWLTGDCGGGGGGGVCFASGYSSALQAGPNATPPLVMATLTSLVVTVITTWTRYFLNFSPSSDVRISEYSVGGTRVRSNWMCLMRSRSVPSR